MKIKGKEVVHGRPADAGMVYVQETTAVIDVEGGNGLPLVCRLCDGHIRLLPGKSALKVRFCQDETRVWLEPICDECDAQQAQDAGHVH